METVFSDGSRGRLLYEPPQTALADLASAYTPRGMAIAVAAALGLLGLALTGRRGEARRAAASGRSLGLVDRGYAERRDLAPDLSIELLDEGYGKLLDAVGALEAHTAAARESGPVQEALPEDSVAALIGLLDYLTRNRASLAAMRPDLPAVRATLSRVSIALAQRADDVSVFRLLRALTDLQASFESALRIRLAGQVAA